MPLLALAGAVWFVVTILNNPGSLTPTMGVGEEYGLR